MKGISAQEFVKKVESINGIETNSGHHFSYQGRELYVLLAESEFPSNEPTTTAYGHWRNHKGYKLASGIWVSQADVPIVDLGILLSDNDGVSGNFIENLGTGRDNSDITTSKSGYRCWLETKSGKLFRATLNNPRGIDRLFRQFDEALERAEK